MSGLSKAEQVGRRVLLTSATTVGRLRRRPVAQGGRLRVLAHVPNFPPGATAGSERSMEAILGWLVGRGHRATVLFAEQAIEGTRDGVQVVRQESLRTTLKLYDRHDLVFTQLGTRNQAMGLARVTRRPLVHFVRMGQVDPDTAFGLPDLLVYNAAWLRDRASWPGRSTVLHPPVHPERYRTTRGEAITLVNLNANKGADIFFALAEKMPDRSFLGVLGDYGQQAAPSAVPANVTLLEPVDDVRDVYARTRVLVMPSLNESYGRVALEAAASGIPTIGSQAPGIREALGSAGTFVERTDIGAWVNAILALDDADAYAAASSRAHARSDEMAPEGELRDFEAELLALLRPGVRTPLP
jgi:glycosyltransferase involved in cell wall biosynthesis